MNIKKQIPNLITLLNLLSGLIALVYAFDDNLQMAFFWVSMGIFFDFWDGFAARTLKVSSPLGVQLDSLADMVTSGVVPGVAMYQMLAHIQENHEQYNVTDETFYMKLVPFIGFIITLGSCMRLAKFNIDTRQTDSFIGLPTPANALFILSIPVIMSTTQFDILIDIFSNPYVLVFISVFSAFIMNAELPLFSLKIKGKKFSDNKLSIIFLSICVIALVLFKYTAVPFIIGFYILLSIIINKTSNKTV